MTLVNNESLGPLIQNLVTLLSRLSLLYPMVSFSLSRSPLAEMGLSDHLVFLRQGKKKPTG